MRELDRVMRTLAPRAISAYRILHMVSLDATSLLARIPPLYLLMRERKCTFECIKDMNNNNELEKSREEAVKNIRQEKALLMRRQWALHLQRLWLEKGQVKLSCMEQ